MQIEPSMMRPGDIVQATDREDGDRYLVLRRGKTPTVHRLHYVTGEPVGEPEKLVLTRSEARIESGFFMGYRSTPVAYRKVAEQQKESAA